MNKFIILNKSNIRRCFKSFRNRKVVLTHYQKVRLANVNHLKSIENYLIVKQMYLRKAKVFKKPKFGISVDEIKKSSEKIILTVKDKKDYVSNVKDTIIEKSKESLSTPIVESTRYDSKLLDKRKEKAKLYSIDSNEELKGIYKFNAVMSKRRKIRIASVLGALLVGTLSLNLVLATINSEKSKIYAREDLVFEYGSNVVLEPSTFVDTTKMNNTVLKNLKLDNGVFKDKSQFDIDEDNVVTSVGSEFLKVGTYTVTLESGDKKVDVTFKVQDTQAPVFNNYISSIRVARGTSKIDYSRYFVAYDTSDEVTIKYDDSLIDLNKLGNYTLKVWAVDKYGNKSEKKDVNVEVTNPVDGYQESDGVYYTESHNSSDTVEEEEDTNSCTSSLPEGSFLSMEEALQYKAQMEAQGYTYTGMYWSEDNCGRMVYKVSMQ